jgi:hypothetical protein
MYKIGFLILDNVPLREPSQNPERKIKNVKNFSVRIIDNFNCNIIIFIIV